MPMRMITTATSCQRTPHTLFHFKHTLSQPHNAPSPISTYFAHSDSNSHSHARKIRSLVRFISSLVSPFHLRQERKTIISLSPIIPYPSLPLSPLSARQPPRSKQEHQAQSTEHQHKPVSLLLCLILLLLLLLNQLLNPRSSESFLVFVSPESWTPGCVSSTTVPSNPSAPRPVCRVPIPYIFPSYRWQTPEPLSDTWRRILSHRFTARILLPSSCCSMIASSKAPGSPSATSLPSPSHDSKTGRAQWLPGKPIRNM